MIKIDELDIDEKLGIVYCPVSVLREGLYKWGEFPVNVSCIDKEEKTLYNSAIEKLDCDWNLFDEIQITTEWFTPEPWDNLNIKEWCLAKCNTPFEINRVIAEYELFEKFQLEAVLKHLKYVVDTWREKNIVWGLGRGSSISSYVLYLIGLHKINPLEYDLDYREF